VFAARLAATRAHGNQKSQPTQQLALVPAMPQIHLLLHAPFYLLSPDWIASRV
jgi:hypothetical protein